MTRISAILPKSMPAPRTPPALSITPWKISVVALPIILGLMVLNTVLSTVKAVTITICHQRGARYRRSRLRVPLKSFAFSTGLPNAGPCPGPRLGRCSDRRSGVLALMRSPPLTSERGLSPGTRCLFSAAPCGYRCPLCDRRPVRGCDRRPLSCSLVGRR